MPTASVSDVPGQMLAEGLQGPLWGGSNGPTAGHGWGHCEENRFPKGHKVAHVEEEEAEEGVAAEEV